MYLAIDLNTLKTRLSDVITRGVAIAREKAVLMICMRERTPLYEAYADLTIIAMKWCRNRWWHR
ncbi:MAG: hypothetical protein U5K27_01885 [Desulfotignum sp.]|nr:hypothetical protein [Desulfotignum sp.]